MNNFMQNNNGLMPSQTIINREKRSIITKKLHKQGKLNKTHYHNRYSKDELYRLSASPEAIKKRKETYKNINH